MRKLAWFAFSFAVAIFVSQYLITPGLLPLAAVLAGIIGAVLYAALRGDRRAAAAIAALGLAAGFLWDFGYDTFVLSGVRGLDGAETTVSASVVDFPVFEDYRVCVDVRVDIPGRPDVKARAYFYDGSADGLRPGDRIRLRALFSSADTVGEERLTTFTSRGIFLFARNAGVEEVLSSPGMSFTNFHRYLSRAIKDMIEKLFSGRDRAFMLALLTGDRTELNADVPASTAMERAGVTHIVAISGMHVSILAGFLLSVLGRRRWAAAVTAPVLVIFMAVSGFSASVVRAVIMQIFLLAAPWFMRENDSLTALAAALLFLLLVNPCAIAGAGLQLSFAATLGIVTISPRIQSFLTGGKKPGKGFRGDVLRWLTGGAATSLGALALTAPISAYYFGCVSLIAPVSNLLILWAVTPAFMLGALSVGAGFVWLPLGRVVAFYPAVLSRLILAICRLLARPFFAAVYLDGPVKLWFVAAYAAIVCMLLFKIRPRRLLIAAPIFAAALCGIFIVEDFAARGGEGYTLTALNVGQGQSIVITSGEYTAVIDCGSSSGEDAGEIAERYIRGLGRGSVDALILTHYHSDHAGGAARLLSTLHISALIVPEPKFEESGLDEEVIAAAESAGCEVIYVTDLTRLTLGMAELTLYPPMGTESENERGLMALVSDGEFDTLITGDAPGYIERQLIARWDIPDTECLVAGHHGSAGSTTERLLDAVTPELAIISVGENSYGHPTEETLSRLAGRDISVLRTDESGNITIHSR